MGQPSMSPSPNGRSSVPNACRNLPGRQRRRRSEHVRERSVKPLPAQSSTYRTAHSAGANWAAPSVAASPQTVISPALAPPAAQSVTAGSGVGRPERLSVCLASGPPQTSARCPIRAAAPNSKCVAPAAPGRYPRPMEISPNRGNFPRFRVQVPPRTLDPCLLPAVIRLPDQTATQTRRSRACKLKSLSDTNHLGMVRCCQPCG